MVDNDIIDAKEEKLIRSATNDTLSFISYFTIYLGIDNILYIQSTDWESGT